MTDRSTGGRVGELTAHTLSDEFPHPRTFEFDGGIRRIFKRDAILVELTTTDGLVGYAPVGASSSAMREYFEGATQDDLTEVLNTVVADAVEGEPTEPIASVTETVSALDLPTAISSQAASAVDIALYDVAGKRHGASVASLLRDRLSVDGPPARRLPMYASGGMYMPAHEYLREARSLRDADFTAYKYRPGRGPEADRRTLETLVEGVGDEMDIMVDAHTWWKLGDRSYGSETVEDLVQHAADHGAYWVEEPVPPEAFDGYRRLAETTTAPLAGGENAESPAELIALEETGAVDYLQGDVRHHEGYTGCLRAMEHCQGTETTFVPHNFGTHLGLVANAHLVAASPAEPYLEYPAYETETHDGMYPYPLAAAILETELDLTDGALTLPDGPGLGVEVDRSVVEEYPHVPGPWTEFVYD